MRAFYTCFAQPVSWLILRITIGGLLTIEGWPKIQAPLAMSGFVESIGFYPGWFWSPLLAVMQFVGGIAIVIGLFTRPIAFANARMLSPIGRSMSMTPAPAAFVTILSM